MRSLETLHRRLLIGVAAIIVASAATISLAQTDDVAAVRAAIASLDTDAAIETSRGAVARNPASSEFHAYAIEALALRSPRAAEREARAFAAVRADDPWAWRSVALTARQRFRGMPDALAASEKMLALAKDPAPAMFETRAQILAEAGRVDEALALLEGALARRDDYGLRAWHARLLQYRPGAWEGDAIAPSLAECAKLRELAPSRIEGYFYAFGPLAHQKKFDEALPLAAQAVTVAPLALAVHRAYWQAIAGAKSIAKNDKDARIGADLDALLAAHPDAPAALQIAATGFQQLKQFERAAALRNELLTKYPQSAQAEWAMYTATADYVRDVDPAKREEPEYLRGLAASQRSFLAYPFHSDERLLMNAWGSYFSTIAANAESTNADVFAAGEGALEFGSEDVRSQLRVLAAYADRRIDLARTERRARAALPLVEEEIAELRDDEWKAHEAESLRGEAHGTLGIVLLARGKFESAKRELTRARTIAPDSAAATTRLGRWYEARGDAKKAVQLYAIALGLESNHVARAALLAMYEKRHAGSREGFDGWVATELAATKRTVLAKRAASPKKAPEFTLRDLDGATVRLADLKGKVAVINFWGVWCTWCVREMPDLDRVARKYAHDADVAILTINNDPDAEKVRQWLAEKKYGVRVLVDDGYVANTAKIGGFPTTWFLDREGRIAFDVKGASENLTAEYDWRIDALR